MSLGAILCWTAWGFVIFNVDPFLDAGLGITFFYISLFFSLLGTISILIFFWRRFLSRVDSPLFRYVQKSFRDSFIFSIIFIFGLFLQSKGYLQWWNIGIFLIGIFFWLIFRWSVKKDKSEVNYFSN